MINNLDSYIPAVIKGLAWVAAFVIVFVVGLSNLFDYSDYNDTIGYIGLFMGPIAGVFIYAWGILVEAALLYIKKEKPEDEE